MISFFCAVVLNLYYLNSSKTKVLNMYKNLRLFTKSSRRCSQVESRLTIRSVLIKMKVLIVLTLFALAAGKAVDPNVQLRKNLFVSLNCAS